MTEVYNNMFLEEQKVEGKKKCKSIMIAPSWQKDNILDSCIEEMLDHLI